MRITGGRARGIPLQVPGHGVRPATDRIREALFASLGEFLLGGRFLDLFAGSGAYGLEAWSRGAAGGDFVDVSAASCRAIKENLARVAKSGKLEVADCRVWRASLPRWHPPAGSHYRVIFSDPPYADATIHLPGVLALASNYLEPDGAGRLVWESAGESVAVPPPWQIVRTFGKGRGNPTLLILAPASL